MDVLSGLQDMLGEPETRRRATDFAKRYDQGDPWDGIDDDEAVTEYRRVAPRLKKEEYEEAAREAYAKLRPAQRRELAQLLQKQARQRKLAVGRLSDEEAEDPAALGRYTAGMQQEQPDLLGSLLGGLRGGGRGASAGTAQGGAGDLLSSPIAKAVLAGIAATAMKKVMGRR